MEVYGMPFKPKINDQMIAGLYQAILELETLEETQRFFEDICTIKEIQSISQRLEVAKLLREGKTYGEIEGTTGASTATISRVNRCLHYGANGYKLILDKINREQGSR